MQAPSGRHWALLAFLCITWGLAFYFIAIALRAFGPLTLVSLRLAIGAITLFVLMRLQGLRLPVDGQSWRYFTTLSILGNLIPFVLIAWAETHIPSSQAGLLMALMPISTIVLAHFFVAHEQLTWRRTAGVSLGFAGVAIMVGGDALANLGGPTLTAQLAVIAATFAYAVNTVYAKTLPSMNTLVVGAGSLIVGTVLLGPLALWIERPWEVPSQPAAWLAVTALGILATGIATWVYFLVVSECGPTFLSISNYIIPAISFAAGVALLSEPAAASQVMGLLAVCLGIAISQGRLRGLHQRPGLSEDSD